MGVPCAVLTIAELSNVVNQSGMQNEADSTRYRRTPGAAFLVSGTPTLQRVSDTKRASSFRVSGLVVAIRKRDALTLRGILDRNRRGGGWGAIAAEIGHQLGGKWTARSIRTLSGTLKKAKALYQTNYRF